ncbi:MAG TPA: glycoside hydrolase family 88 protein [Pseudonocardia sp.]|nr:glycoside hydrolase family 88 protein [Pseudonocardia sp.]
MQACASPPAERAPAPETAAPETAAAAPTADPAASAVQRSLSFAEKQLAAEVGRIVPGQYPADTEPNGVWATTDSDDWRCGFFPGMLWQMYERTGDPVWRARAQDWQAPLEPAKTDDSTHDVGFIILTTFGHGFELTGDEAFRATVLTAARTLSTRFTPAVGAIRSWDDIDDTTQYRVIVDNMMNLELLFWAAQHGGDPAWADIASRHARTTARDHVRPDGSTFHVVGYDQATGSVTSQGTAQGFADSSTWARGQAWAVYGFAMTYRYTRDPQFLGVARSAADYWVSHLPADKVPYWDFAVPPDGGEPRDTSAAAIAAAGLLELSEYETDGARKQVYLDTAREMIVALSAPGYLAEGTNNEAILLHGTQNKPGGNFDTGLVVGDYYLIEALTRYERVAAGRSVLAPR